MPEITLDPTWIEKLSLVGVLVGCVMAFLRGWVVPASVHEALRSDLLDARARADRVMAIAETALKLKVGANGGPPRE